MFVLQNADAKVGILFGTAKFLCNFRRYTPYYHKNRLANFVLYSVCIIFAIKYTNTIHERNRAV